MVLGDLDGDGDLDGVATSNDVAYHGLETWINQGNGVFTGGQHLTDHALNAIALGDLEMGTWTLSWGTAQSLSLNPEHRETPTPCGGTTAAAPSVTAGRGWATRAPRTWLWGMWMATETWTFSLSMTTVGPTRCG